jgi:hypothetical protein
MPKSPTVKAPFRAHEPQIEPFSVSPWKATHIEQCGLTELYERLNRGEYETYLDGSKRQITMRSIRARQERLLAAASGTPRENSSPRRGRPRKTA